MVKKEEEEEEEGVRDLTCRPHQRPLATETSSSTPGPHIAGGVRSHPKSGCSCTKGANHDPMLGLVSKHEKETSKHKGGKRGGKATIPHCSTTARRLPPRTLLLRPGCGGACALRARGHF